MTRFRLRRAITVAIALLGSVTAVSIAAPNALAGSNGQQVQVLTKPSIGWVAVCGRNQYNRPRCTPIKHEIPDGFGDGWVTASFGGWWFKGWVDVLGWNPHSSANSPPAASGLCWVPPRLTMRNSQACYLWTR
jgi:hypothetical protein